MMQRAVNRPDDATVRSRSADSSVRRARRGWLFVFPAVAFLLVFFVGPMLYTVYLSFTSYDMLGEPHWIGTDNYGSLTGDRVFLQSLKTTAFYVVGSAVPVGIIALMMALVLQRRGVLTGALVTLYFIPVVVADVVVAVVWRFMLGQFGPVNQALAVIDRGGSDWVGDPQLVPWALIAITVWQWTGWTAIIYMAGLRSIPRHVYDAARLDGAGAWRTFRDITLPLLRPTIFLVVAVSLITGAQSFGYQYIVSGGSGGPLYSTNVIALHIYNTIFRFQDAGYGAAMSVVLLALLIGVVTLLMRVYPSEMKDA